MAEKTKGKPVKQGDQVVNFKCRICELEKPISEMRTVNRFVPVLIVCKDCAKTLR
jgi:hypothetical protein